MSYALFSGQMPDVLVILCGAQYFHKTVLAKVAVPYQFLLKAKVLAWRAADDAGLHEVRYAILPNSALPVTASSFRGRTPLANVHEGVTYARYMAAVLPRYISHYALIRLGRQVRQVWPCGDCFAFLP